MELPTYTSIWRIEKRLYKLYDFRLPMPLPVGQIAVFTAVTVPYIVLLTLFGLPFSHTLFWLYVLPPGLLTWLATRPVLESKRLPELLTSQMRYLGEPSTWCRMAPLAEKDTVVVFGRVWRRASIATQAEPGEAAAAELPVAGRRALPAATVVARPVPARAATGQAAADRATADQAAADQAAADQAAADQAAAKRTAGTAPSWGRGAGPRGPSRGRGRLVRDRRVPERQVPERAQAGPQHAEPARPESARPERVRPERAQPERVRPEQARRAGEAGAGQEGRWPHLPGPAPRPAASRPAAPRPAAPGPTEARSAGEPGLGKDAYTTVANWARDAGLDAGPGRAGSPGTGWPLVGYPTAASLRPGKPASGSAPGQEPAPIADEGANTVNEGAGEAVGTGWPAAPDTAAPGMAAPDTAVASTEAPSTEAPDRRPSVPRRPAPVVIVPAQRSVAGPAQATPARPRPARGVERALSGPDEHRPAGWRSHVTVVPGGRGPGRPDPLKEARARAVLPLDRPRLVVVLGCTVGAGQTVTTLMLADLLAGLRGEPVAALDLNPGPTSLTELAHVPAITVRALLADRVPGAHAAHPGNREQPAQRGPALPRGPRNKGRMDLICQDAAPEGGGPLPNLQHERLVSVLASRYRLTLADPGASAVAKLLAEAGQLVLVAPASPDAARAVSMTCEWLGGHGHGALARRSIAVLNGVSQRSVRHAEQAELVLRGRCRAIVRVPWDDHLAEPEAERGIRDSLAATGGPPRLAQLRPAVLQAYTALAGVLVSALADDLMRRRAAR